MWILGCFVNGLSFGSVFFSHYCSYDCSVIYVAGFHLEIYGLHYGINWPQILEYVRS